jgi:putative FmdB family regulatory protein
MPTYAYACTSCDHRFEAVQSFSDDSLTSCPQCEGRLRKVFSAVGVVFKGSGFYRTDSRSGGSSATLPGGGSDSGSTATKTKTETSTGSNGSGAATTSAGSKTSSSNGSASTSSGQGSAA